MKLAPQVGIAKNVFDNKRRAMDTNINEQDKLEIQQILEAINNESLSFVSEIVNKFDGEEVYAKDYLSHINKMTNDIFNKLNKQ